MAANENKLVPACRLGRMPRKSDPRSLMFAHYVRVPVQPPAHTHFWTQRKPFTPESWGNDVEGCCTIAKQANMFRRFERIELRNKTIEIDAAEVHRVYRDMTQRLYGGGDTGAYEEDALNQSRDPNTCLHDKSGHPLLVDAYVRLNAADLVEIRNAINTAGGHGIAICINLPLGFEPMVGKGDLDFPDGVPLTGDWMPGSWGGHSMWAIEYDEVGMWLEHTWTLPPQRITWRAVSAYVDEAHLVIDSIDAWRHRLSTVGVDVMKIARDVNRVSSHKIDIK